MAMEYSPMLLEEAAEMFGRDGIRPNVTYKDERFFMACRLGGAAHLKELDRIYAKSGLDDAGKPKIVNAFDKSGYTGLMHAAAFGKADIVMKLLEDGADVEVTSDTPGELTAFDFAMIGNKEGGYLMCAFMLKPFGTFKSSDLDNLNLRPGLGDGVNSEAAEAVVSIPWESRDRELAYIRGTVSEVLPSLHSQGSFDAWAANVIIAKMNPEGTSRFRGHGRAPGSTQLLVCYHKADVEPLLESGEINPDAWEPPTQQDEMRWLLKYFESDDIDMRSIALLGSREGLLEKKGGGKSGKDKAYVPRQFVLKGDEMLYFKKKKQQGSIDLSSGNVEVVDDKIVITDAQGRIWNLKSPSGQDDASAWGDAVAGTTGVSYASPPIGEPEPES